MDANIHDIYWTKLITQLGKSSISIYEYVVEDNFSEIYYSTIYKQSVSRSVCSVSTAQLAELKSNWAKRLFVSQMLVEASKRYTFQYSVLECKSDKKKLVAWEIYFSISQNLRSNFTSLRSKYLLSI